MKKLRYILPLIMAVLAPAVLMGAYPGAFAAFLNVAQSWSALQTFSSGASIAASTLVQFEPNAASVGTTVNKLAKLTATGAVVLGTGDSASPAIVGICISNCSTSGNASIAIAGTPSCVFDGATTAGDYVVPSITTGGDCHDTGAGTVPTGIVVIGTIGSTHGSGGTYAIDINPVGISSANNSKTQPGGTSGQIQYNNSNAFGGFTMSGDCTTVTSTGVITCTVPINHLASVAANTYIGNPTSGSAAPAATSIATCSGNNDALTYTTNTGITCATDIAQIDVASIWTKTQSSTPQSLTISTATFTPAAASGNNIKFTLVHASCPCTFANPSGSPISGTSGVIEITQSATGSDTIGTWGSSYLYQGGTSTIALSTAANATDTFSYYVRDSTHIVLTTAALNATH